MNQMAEAKTYYVVLPLSLTVEARVGYFKDTGLGIWFKYRDERGRDRYASRNSVYESEEEAKSRLIACVKKELDGVEDEIEGVLAELVDLREERAKLEAWLMENANG